MDLYRIMNAAESAIDASFDALDDELQLFNTNDDRCMVKVTFLGMMVAKYLALRPDQRLPQSIMRELVLIEKSNLK